VPDRSVPIALLAWINNYPSGVLMIAGSVGLSILGLIVVRKTLHRKDLGPIREVGGHLLAVAGTFYAVSLGLIVVDSMTRFQDARNTTELESNSLADIVLLSNQFPAERRAQVHRLATAYARSVAEVEWPILGRGGSSPDTHRLALDLIDSVLGFEPATNRDQAIYQATVDAVCQFWNCRRTRTFAASHGIPPLEWLVLITGGVITIAFTYFLRIDRLVVQAFMTAMLSLVISLNLYLVLMFGYPYSGDLKVDPEGFKMSNTIMDYQSGLPSRRAP
jgi:hypothetical protein